MADYNQIKTLTIDGTTLGMTEGLGLTYTQENTRAGAVSADTEYTGVSMTFTEAGAYVVRASIYFPTASTTGATSHLFWVTGEGSADRLLATSQVDASNKAVRLADTGVINVASPPATYTTKFQCSRAIAASSGLQTQIRASRIVRVPTT